jgi:hypothetical protein
MFFLSTISINHQPSQRQAKTYTGRGGQPRCNALMLQLSNPSNLAAFPQGRIKRDQAQSRVIQRNQASRQNFFSFLKSPRLPQNLLKFRISPPKNTLKKYAN